MSRRIFNKERAAGITERSLIVLKGEPLSANDVRALPRELLEPHPLVIELRQELQSKDTTLADKDREIARLQVAIAFGIKDLPVRFHPDI